MLLLTLITASVACPTIATGTPSGLSFDVAQVAIARQDSRTTFTVSINPAGDPQEFALVLPVPALLAEDEIRVLNPTIFERLNGYSAPRRVTDAGCPQDYSDSDTDADADTDSDSDADTGTVEVEAQYIVGEYSIVILSAEESSGLQSWLDANSYYLPEGAEPFLQEYIDAENYFLAAKVADEKATADGEPLSPLQVSYDSEVFSIPIRLATLNSPGEQDMVIYALTPASNTAKDGQRAGIANYSEFDVPDTCIWGDIVTDDFDEFYEEQYTEAWEAVGEGAWTVEYAGTWNDANPVSSIQIDSEDIEALGFEEASVDHHLTRIRMRYTPEQATEDLIFYGSGIYEPLVTPFADDTYRNRKCVDVCGEEPGETDETGEGPDVDTDDESSGVDAGGDTAPAEDTGVIAEKPASACSCAAASGGPAATWVLLIGVVGLVRRQRSVTL